MVRDQCIQYTKLNSISKSFKFKTRKEQMVHVENVNIKCGVIVVTFYWQHRLLCSEQTKQTIE